MGEGKDAGDLDWLGQAANNSDNVESSDLNPKKSAAMRALEAVFA
jgi:hypothetical protein